MDNDISFLVSFLFLKQLPLGSISILVCAFLYHRKIPFVEGSLAGFAETGSFLHLISSPTMDPKGATEFQKVLRICCDRKNGRKQFWDLWLVWLRQRVSPLSGPTMDHPLRLPLSTQIQQKHFSVFSSFSNVIQPFINSDPAKTFLGLFFFFQM